MTGDHAGDTIRTGHGEDPEALVVYSLDSAAANRRDEAARAVERAQHTGEPVSPWFSSQALACLNC